MNRAALARAGLHPGPLLCALAVLVLLGAFVAVIRNAVREADASRRANALLDEAHWRCKALKMPLQRDDCLRHFDHERPRDSAALQLLVSAAAARPMATLGPAR